MQSIRSAISAISILQDAGASLALSDIVIELAERDGFEGEEMWARAHQNRIELHQRHLPRLDETDIVGYEENRAIAWGSPDQPESTPSTKAASP